MDEKNGQNERRTNNEVNKQICYIMTTESIYIIY
jgi:hypothetical protein